MAYIRERKGKKTTSFEITISNGKNGVIRKGGFKSKKEAQKAIETIKKELNKYSDPDKIPFTLYFSDWFELYKAPRITLNTLKHYQYSLKAISDYFLDTPIQDIKRSDYQRFLNEFGKNKAKETVVKVHGHIKACVKDAIEEHVILIDFTRKTSPSWTNKEKKSFEKHLDFQQSKQLINILWNKINEGLNYSCLLLIIVSGIRFGEAMGLTSNDFDFKKNTIRISKTWDYKTGLIGFCPTKNESSIRTIRLDRRTMCHFKKIIKSIEQNIEENPNKLIFFNGSKNSVISNSILNKTLRNILMEIKAQNISVHGLRHTHASILLYKKVSIQYISQRLGHSNIEITLNKYAHIIRELHIEDENKTIEIFNDI